MQISSFDIRPRTSASQDLLLRNIPNSARQSPQCKLENRSLTRQLPTASTHRNNPKAHKSKKKVRSTSSMGSNIEAAITYNPNIFKTAK